MKKYKFTINAFLLGSLLLSGCSGKTKEEYTLLAEKYRSQGENSKAVIELKNAVQLSPDDAEIRAFLGELYLEQGQFQLAEKEMQSAVELGFIESETLAMLMKTRYYTQSYIEVIKLFEEYSDSLANSQIGGLYFYLSKLALDEKSTSIPSYLQGDYKLLAEASQLYIRKQFKLALQKTQSFTDEKIEPIEKMILVGGIALNLEMYKEAVDAFLKVTNLAPSVATPKIQLVEALIRNEQYELADKRTNALLNNYKNSPYINYLKSMLLFEEKDYKDAFVYAEKAIQLGLGDFTSALVIAGVSAYKTNKLETAYFYLKKAEPALPNSSLVRRALTQVQLQLGYTNEATEELVGWSKLEQSDSEVFALAAAQLATQGNLRQANELMRVVNTKLDVTPVQELREGILKVASNDNEGLKIIESALQREPTFNQAWIALAESYIASGQPEDALRVAEDWEKTDKVSGLALKALVFSNFNRNAEASQTVENALRFDSEHLGANQAKLTILLAEKKYDVALEQAVTILKLAPSNQRALFVVSEIGSQTQYSAVATRILQEHAESYPNLIITRVALADLFRKQQKPEKAVDLLESQVDKLDEFGWIVLGDSALQARKYQLALSFFNNFRKKYSSNKTAWLRTVGVYELVGNVEKATELASQASLNFPQEMAFKTMLVKYHTQRGDLREAEKNLELIKSANINSPVIERLEGELDLAKNDFNKASIILRSHYEKYPSFEVAILLARAYQKNKEVKKAEAVLEREYERSADKTRIRHSLAEFYSYQNEFERSSEYYEEAIAANSNDFVALNNLALLKLKSKDYKSAKKYAKLAFDMVPDNPNIADTYGYSLFLSGNYTEALDILYKAYETSPQNVDIALNLAEVLVQSGIRERSRDILNEVRPVTKRQREKFSSLRDILKKNED
ncbi:lipoprotein [Alteromonas sp. KUL156]|nr:lipoprotein [Alteromonas sp. KUL154]GFE00177.1 lipoprotein [Alteromonas sp. KUL156]